MLWAQKLKLIREKYVNKGSQAYENKYDIARPLMHSIHGIEKAHEKSQTKIITTASATAAKQRRTTTIRREKNPKKTWHEIETKIRIASDTADKLIVIYGSKPNMKSVCYVAQFLKKKIWSIKFQLP